MPSFPGYAFHQESTAASRPRGFSAPLIVDSERFSYTWRKIPRVILYVTFKRGGSIIVAPLLNFRTPLQRIEDFLFFFFCI